MTCRNLRVTILIGKSSKVAHHLLTTAFGRYARSHSHPTSFSRLPTLVFTLCASYSGVGNLFIYVFYAAVT